MAKIHFSTALLLAPLAYSVHHFEEHILFNFREWRLLYFPDSNALSTELVFMILTAITIIYVLLQNLYESKAAAMSALLFLMATQVQNALFHLGATLYFWDFSPGLYTALLLYLPVNFLIVKTALEEGWVTVRSVIVLFILGGASFWLFEVFGPLVIGITVLGTLVWILADGMKQTSAL